MRHSKWLVLLLAAACAHSGEVGNYPNAVPLNGSERILADQGGPSGPSTSGNTVNITLPQIQTYLFPNGYLPASLMPVLTGDCFTTTGSFGIICTKSNGVPFSTLATAPTAAAIVDLFSDCSGTAYLGADGACHAASGSGTVTSIGITLPAWLTVSPSSITTSGTFAITGTSEPANYVVASPIGSAGAASPRALVAADIPTISATSGLSGTLQAAQFPALSGDVFAVGSSLSTRVVGINEVTLSSLATGILKNTTSTGVPSIAVAADFPTLNQSTTGNAATATSATTATNIAGGASSEIPYQTGAGATSFLTLGSNLSLSGSTLNASGGGTPGGSSFSLQYNNAGSFAGLLPGSTGVYCLDWPSLSGAPTLSSSCPSSGGSTVFQANGSALTSDTTVNFENSAATNGLTLTFANPSAGNVQLGFTGTLANAGLANSSVTLGSTNVALGATATTIGGLTSVTSTGFTGALTGHASLDLPLTGGTLTGALTGTTIGGTTVSASTQFSGPGTGITGTASSLSIGGNAATATSATTATNVTATSNSSLTTLSALSLPSTQVTGLGTFATQSYATPPAIGGTTPAAGAFTTLSASSGTFSSTASGVTIGSPTGGAEGAGTLNMAGCFVNGVACGGSGSSGANPTGTVGLTAVNGSATTFLRSDGAPALSQGITPTWTGLHKFTNGDFSILGSSTGYTLLESGLASTSNNTLTLPTTATDTLAALGTAETFSALQTFGTNISIGGVTPTGATGTGALVFGTAPTITLANGTGLPISTGVGGLGTGVAAFLATPSSANLATAVTGETGTGALVFGTSPTLVTPALGTPSSGVATNLTGTATALNIGGTAANLSGTPALPNGTTATTQTTGDNTTKVATDAFVLANAASAGVSSVAAGGGIAVTGTGGGPFTGAVTVSASAPNRTVTSSPTVASTDMGGQINSNVSGGGTLTIPAISSSVFPANSTLTVVNYSASTETVSTTPTVNAGGGCVSGTGIPAGAAWNILSNGTTLDCNQTVSAGGGSGTVASSTTGQIPVYTAATTVTGSANATLTAGALTLGVSGTAGSVKLGNATSGTVTVQPVTGALGTVTASLPANTGTIGELNLAQTWSALQTFGTNISIGGVTATGATGTGNSVFATSPTLTTPNLGTPSAATLTNATGLPISTGVSGLATGIAAQLAANTTFTIAPTGCTPSAHAGGAFGGTITLATGPCTSIVVTMNGATGYTAAHGYDCSVDDQTTQAAGTWIPKWGQSAQSTTTATIPIPTAAGATDVISFACVPN